jgi:Cys-tRNA(Pro)/Cys-tRNA(Cys) deacylase
LFPHYAEPVARAATPAIAALLAAQVPHQVLQYHHDPRNESFGEEAVEALAQVEGVRPEQVFKTLVIALPKGLAVAVIPVPSKLSLKAGYIIGGISPPTFAPPNFGRTWVTDTLERQGACHNPTLDALAKL